MDGNGTACTDDQSAMQRGIKALYAAPSRAMYSIRFSPVLLVALALAGCNSSPSGSSIFSSKSTLPVQPVQAQVTKRDIVGYDIFPAQLVIPTDAKASVLPPYQAPVEKLYVEAGDWVRKGQPLIKLSMPTVQASVDQAAMTYKQAQAAYQSAKSQYDAPLKAAQDQLSQARAAEKQARLAAQSGDTSMLDQATQTRVAAEAAVMQAQQDLKNNLYTYAQQVDAAGANYKAAKAGTRITEVTAPIAGLVTGIYTQAGQTIGEDASKPVADIVDVAQMRVQATLNPDQAIRLKKNMPVVVEFREIPDQQFKGIVESISTMPQRDANGRLSGAVWIATIRVDDPKRLVKPGMLITLCGVRTGEVFNVLSIPLQGVAYDASGRAYVNVQQGNAWVVKYVQTGLTDGKYIQITSGLTENDVVQVPPQKKA